MTLTDEEKLQRAQEAARVRADIKKRKELLKEHNKIEREAIKDLEGEVDRLLGEVLTGEAQGELSLGAQQAVERFQNAVNDSGFTIRTKAGGETYEHAPQR
jgi:hypothetical protein